MKTRNIKIALVIIVMALAQMACDDTVTISVRTDPQCNLCTGNENPNIVWDFAKQFVPKPGELGK